MPGEPPSEAWFLRHGFPATLPRRARWRRLLPRSAPVLAAWSALMVLSTVVMAASGGQDINIEDDPTPAQWVTLIVFFLIPPASLVVGRLVSLIRHPMVLRIIAVVAVVVGTVSDWYEDDPSDAVKDLLVDMSTVAVILIATGIGAGAIVGWSARMVLSHLKTVGRLMARSLPVVLLTVLVFFNATVWTIAASLDTARLCLLVMFMAAIAIAFLVAGLLDAIQPVLTQHLGRGERANVLLLAVIAQVIQMLTLAVVTGAVFFVLGLIVLTPPVLAKLTNGAPTQSVWFDITLPVATAHVHITIFLTALTFMYVSARAVSDTEYRTTFLDPLLDDLKLVVDARDRFRSNPPARQRESPPPAG